MFFSAIQKGSWLSFWVFLFLVVHNLPQLCMLQLTLVPHTFSVFCFSRRGLQALRKGATPTACLDSIFLHLVVLRVSSHCLLCACPSLCPNFPVSQGHQSYWIRPTLMMYLNLISSVKTLLPNKVLFLRCWCLGFSISFKWTPFN